VESTFFFAHPEQNNKQQEQRTREATNIFMTDDYIQRSENYGFATREEIKEALKHPLAVCLDVRTEDEIAAQPYETDKKWVHSGCRPNTCPVLEKIPEKLLPDKDGKRQ
jgi:hypothetical protein